MQNNFFKGVLSFFIIIVLIIIAWKLLKFTIGFVLPVAIVAFVAYVIYLLVTGKKV